MASRETENNAYAKFWGDKQSALWYVMVFSGVVNLRQVQKKTLNKKPSGSYVLSTSFPGFSPTRRAGRREPWE